MTQREVVLQYFREAQLTPSAIDAMLRLPNGRAHDLIVTWWQDQVEGKAEIDEMVAALETKPRVTAGSRRTRR